MNDFGCKGLVWDHSASDEPGMGAWKAASHLEGASRVLRENVPDTLRPSKSYSKRSSLINELRGQSRWQAENAGFDLVELTKAAVISSESFINHLPEGCLDLEIAVSHSGEINFFFRAKADLFQVLIDESGLMSFYGKIAKEEIRGNEVPPSNFDYLKLLKFVDQYK